MKITYTPTDGDVLQVLLFERRKSLREWWIAPVALLPAVVAVGAMIMALDGSPWWFAAAMLAGLISLLLCGSVWRSFGPPAVAREMARSRRPNVSYTLEATETGVTCEEEGWRADTPWESIEGLEETSTHLILRERAGMTRMAYGLAKRELQMAGGVAPWREFLAARVRAAGGRVRTR